MLIHIQQFKVAEEEFIDDYERPVLEKYEKITPTPLEKKKKVHFYTLILLHQYILIYFVTGILCTNNYLG